MSRKHRPRALDWLPVPTELDEAPALAVLAVMAAGLDVAVMALMAAHPDLADVDRPYWLPRSPAVAPANVIVRLADRMREAIGNYRRTVLPPSASIPDDKIPF
jgi:hypothetical protein